MSKCSTKQNLSLTNFDQTIHNVVVEWSNLDRNCVYVITPNTLLTDVPTSYLLQTIVELLNTALKPLFTMTLMS